MLWLISQAFVSPPPTADPITSSCFVLINNCSSYYFPSFTKSSFSHFFHDILLVHHDSIYVILPPFFNESIVST